MSESARPQPDADGCDGADAIRVENISKSFGVVRALEDVSLHVRPARCSA